MDKKEFSRKEAVKFGWETAKENFGFFLVVIIVIILISALSGFLQKQSGGLGFLTSIVFAVVGMIFQMGVIKSCLKFVDGQKPELEELFSQYKLTLNFVIATILYSLILAAGFILLIVPGIIWGLRYSYYSYLIVDKGLKPIEALKESAKITYGAKGKLFIFWLLLAGIIILGTLALGVGLLWAMPTVVVAWAYVYRKLSSAAKEIPAVQPAPAATPPAAA